MRARFASATTTRSDEPRRGYVIFAVLVVIVVLSLVAYRFTDSMTSEYRAAVRQNDDAQAKAAAVSGIHYTAAVLSDRETFYSVLGGNPYDNSDIFEQFEVVSPEGASARKTYFSIRAVALNDSGSIEQRFGVIDEGGKLNINSMIALDPTGQVLHDALMKLPDMTEDIADAIVDWVDADEDPRAAGAESTYYQSLPGAYKSKNGPLNSLDELLLVKGVTPYLLYGGDRNRNGAQDEGEDDGTRGWSDFLTVYGRELNVDMNGTARIYINDEDLDTAYKKLEQALGADMATYILGAKVIGTSSTAQSGTTSGMGSGMGSGTVSGTATVGANGQMTITINGGGGNQQNQGNQQSKRPTVTGTTQQLYDAVQAKMASSGSTGKRLRSLLDLTDTQITLPRAQGARNEDPDVVVPSPLNDPGQRNQLIGLLIDKTTTRQAIEMVPRINVNTAPREVLMGLTNRSGQPLLQDAEIQSILDQRADQAPTDPATVSGAWLITSNILTPSRYKQVERYLTGSTMVYRVQAVGYTDRGGPVSRIEAVIDTNQGSPRFLHFRDLTDLDNPRGFPPPTQQPNQ